MYKRAGAAGYITPPLVLVLLLLMGCATHKGEYFDSAGTRLHYSVRGKGEPVILVHGFAMDAERNWRWTGISRALAKDHQVVLIDLRGHGKSDKPHGPAAYGVNMSEDVVRLMDHLHLDRAHVVGYSLGGFITLKLVTTHPERLISAIPCAAGWEKASGENMSKLKSLGESVDGPEGFRPLFAELGLPDRGPLNRAVLCLADRYLRAHNDTVALAAALESISALAVTEAELRANRVPVLSVVGTKDALRPGVDNLDGVMSEHQTVHIRGGNHATTVIRHSFQKAIRDFLEKHRSSPVEALNKK
ncbi:MAG: alpha/beta hydrolase [Candidatus Hydrogenedentes bacterium]|nr:alpha/beta hydrolase [Candidatus Hydrogenedentota bacterium]